MHAIGPYHQVVGLGQPRPQLDPHAPLHQLGADQRGGPARGQLRDAGPKDLQQVAAAQAHRRPHPPPERLLVHREQQPPGLVAVLPPPDAHAPGHDLLSQPQAGQRPQRVAGQVQAQPRSRRRRQPLHQRARHPPQPQRPSQAKPGDPTSHHQQPIRHHKPPREQVSIGARRPRRQASATGPPLGRWTLSVIGSLLTEVGPR